MQQRRYGSYRELELETQAHVHQDAGYRQQHAQPTLITQLFTHLRTDELHTLDPHLAAVPLLDHPGDLVTHFRIVAGEANDDVGAGAEVLHDGIVPARLMQGGPHRIQISRLTVV